MNIKLQSKFEGVTFHLELNEDILTLWADEDELEPIAIKIIPENRFDITHDEGQIETIIEPETKEVIDHIWQKYYEALLEWGNAEIKKLSIDAEVTDGNYCDSSWFPNYQLDLD